MSLSLQLFVFGLPMAFAAAVLIYMEFMSRVGRWWDRERHREFLKMQRTRGIIAEWRWNNTPMED